MPYHGKTPVSSDQQGSFVVPRNKEVDPVDNRPKPVVNEDAPNIEPVAEPVLEPVYQQPLVNIETNADIEPIQATNPGQPVALEPVRNQPAPQVQPGTPQMTPAKLAEYQAQLLARAILEAQRIGRTGQLPPQTYKASEPERPKDDEEPTIMDMRDVAPTQASTSATHGERVIQPIHDVVRERQREDMSRRIAELLGDADFNPVTISTTTLKHGERSAKKSRGRKKRNKQQEQGEQPQIQQVMPTVAANMPAQTTPQQLFPTIGLSGQVVAPSPATQMMPAAMPAMPQPAAMAPQIYTTTVQVNPEQQITRQQEYVEQQYQPVTPATSHGITSQMQDPRLEIQSPNDMQSMDPRLAIMQQQQLMAAEAQRLAANQAYQAQYAQIAAQQQAAMQGIPPQQVVMQNPAQQQVMTQQTMVPAQQLTPEQYAEMQQAMAAQQAMAPAEQKTIGFKPVHANGKRRNLRVSEEIVKKAALASILESQKKKKEPEPEDPIEAIRPAYIEELEEELAGDMKKKDSSAMSDRMAEELADDESTINAASIKVEEPEPTETQEVDATPQFILDAIAKANSIANIDTTSSDNPNMDDTPNISGDSPNISSEAEDSAVAEPAETSAEPATAETAEVPAEPAAAEAVEAPTATSAEPITADNPAPSESPNIENGQ